MYTHVSIIFQLYLSITDIDECSLDTDGCEHNCNNTIGNFICSCITGYVLTLDSKTCTGKHNACLNFTTVIITYVRKT